MTFDLSTLTLRRRESRVRDFGDIDNDQNRIFLIKRSRCQTWHVTDNRCTCTQTYEDTHT